MSEAIEGQGKLHHAMLQQKRGFFHGLSGKLLILSAICVVLAEILIFVPSVSSFRLRWLEERLETAATVGMMLVESSSANISRQVQDDVLTAIGAKAIAIRDEEGSHLLVVSGTPAAIDLSVDLDDAPWPTAMHDAVDSLLSGEGRVMRVYGSIPENHKQFEVIIDEQDLREDMIVYARDIAFLSLIIPLIMAIMLFLATQRMMIRPVQLMTRSMLDFAKSPENPAHIIKPQLRHDELGVAERELAAMQVRLQNILAQQKRLADLGLAVSKINHDMRNILAAAQLISDRLSMVDDPTVQQVVPKLMRSLDRALSYSEGVLAYGKTQEAAPKLQDVELKLLVDELHDLLMLRNLHGIEVINSVDDGFQVRADPEQLFRVLFNLARNAMQAMNEGNAEDGNKCLTIKAEQDAGNYIVSVLDNGPGLPAIARQNLFSAFRGSTRSGGTGLGLAIAQELIQAHGGRIELVESRKGHTQFSIIIPRSA